MLGPERLECFRIKWRPVSRKLENAVSFFLLSYLQAASTVSGNALGRVMHSVLLMGCLSVCRRFRLLPI